MKSVCKYCPRSAMCLADSGYRWRSIKRLWDKPLTVRCYPTMQRFAPGPIHGGAHEFELPKELI